MTRSVRFFAVGLVVLSGLPAIVVSTAWLTGSVESDIAPADADYLWRPLEIGDDLRLALGLAATLLAVGVIVLVWRWLTDRVITQAVAIVLLAGGLIAAYGGVLYGAATAPVVGANIGGGLMLLGAGPFVLVTVAVTAVAVVRERSRHARVQPPA